MNKVNLEKGFYALTWCRFECCDTGKIWTGDKTLNKFNTKSERDEFLAEWQGDNYDGETTPRYVEFEVRAE